MKKLVFICHGNTLRSPIAEALFNKDPKDGWKAYSYGTLVNEERIEGESIREVSAYMDIVIDEMKKQDTDISTKHTKRLYPELLKDADKVIVMSEEKETPEWLSDKRYERWDIPNPETLTQEISKEIIDLLTDKILELKTRL